jgi:O-antigen ligase
MRTKSPDLRVTSTRPPASARRNRGRRGARAAQPASARGDSAADSDTSRSSGAPWPERAAALTVTLLLVMTPLLVMPDLKESFRLVQGLATGWLGLASLAIASWSLREPAAAAAARRVGATTRDAAGSMRADDAVSMAWIWRRPAVRALVPLSLVVAAGGLFTAHPAHFHAAFADFAIGVVCLVGWSLAFDAATLRRLLVWTIPAGVLVALLGLDQFAGWFGTLDWLHIEAPTARLRLTSTIGNPGDLASMLVLPVIIAVSELPRYARFARAALVGAIVVMVATIAVTATFAAGVAAVVGIVVWLILARGRRGLMSSRVLAAIAVSALVALGAATLLAPLRTRIVEKTMELAHGDVNALLTGRLDGWRVAVAMLQRAPIVGVGQGAYRAEYADTRLALEARGVPFYREQQQVILATPHNEALSVAAEQGIPGLLALAWAVWWLFQSTVRLTDTSQRALAWAGISALAILCSVSFPLHVASVAFPWLLFFAWMFRASDMDMDAEARA